MLSALQLGSFRRKYSQVERVFPVYQTDQFRPDWRAQGTVQVCSSKPRVKFLPNMHQQKAPELLFREKNEFRHLSKGFATCDYDGCCAWTC